MSATTTATTAGAMDAAGTAAGAAVRNEAGLSDPSLKIAGLCKRYGDFVALAPTEIDVAQGEFLTLLGPSGSGKTTLLSLIAGLLSVAMLVLHGAAWLSVKAEAGPVMARASVTSAAVEASMGCTGTPTVRFTAAREAGSRSAIAAVRPRSPEVSIDSTCSRLAVIFW